MKRKKVHNCRVVKHNLEPKNRHPFQQVLRPVDAVSMHNTMHVNVNRLCPMIAPIQGLFLMQSILELVYLVLTYHDHLVFRLWIPENIMFFVEKYLSFTKEQYSHFTNLLNENKSLRYTTYYTYHIDEIAQTFTLFLFGFSCI